MVQLWSRGGLSWPELIKRTWIESWQDEVFGQGARLAFYHFLAIFPALLLLMFFLIKITGPAPELRKTLLDSFRQVLPARAYGFVNGMVKELSGKAIIGTGLFSGLLGSLWASVNGTWALMNGLNMAYEVKEERPVWKLTATAISLTVCLAVLGLLSLVLIFYGGRLAQILAPSAGTSPGTVLVLLVVRWPVIVLLLLTAFAVLYRFGPNLSNRKWQWSTPGAVLAVILWITATLLARVYFAYSRSYEEIYGHLASVSMFLIWLYLTNGAILIGGELNSEIEKAADKKSSSYRRGQGDDDGRSGR